MARVNAQGVLAELRDGKLRAIGPMMQKLTPPQRHALAREVSRLLQHAVSSGELGHGHRWLITSLQYLAPPEAGDVLVRTLAQAVNLQGCCGCTLNRTMRAVAAVRPPEAIPVLVDVIECARHPRHQHLAAVCLAKIGGNGDGAAEAVLAAHRARLRRALRSLRQQMSATTPATSSRPWQQPPGSPGWFAAAQRAEKAIARLLA